MFKKECEMKKIEMIGKKFGKLLVISECVDRNKNGHIKYKCECECGELKNVFGTHLRECKIVSCGCYNRIDGNSINGDQWYRIILSGINVRNKRRKMEFGISKEYINNLYMYQRGLCALSGLEITLPKTWKDSSFTASLDRIDSNIGYIVGNVQWVHKHINIIKNSFPQEMFIYLCNQVSSIHRSEYFDINSFKWGLNEKYF